MQSVCDWNSEAGPDPEPGHVAIGLIHHTLASQAERSVNHRTCAAIFRKGRLLFEGSYCGNETCDLKASRYFAIGSQSKMIASVTLADLIDRGLLSDAVRVSDFLPEVRAGCQGRLGERRLGELMRHRSPFGQLEERSKAATVSSLLPLARPGAGREQIVSLIKSARFTPGTVVSPAFQYGDINYALIGLAIEWATGRSYRKTALGLLRRIGGSEIDPAGPTVGTTAAKNLVEGIAFDAIGERITIRPKTTTVFGPAQGAVSSARGICGFVDALVNGKVLSPRGTNFVLSGRLPFGPSEAGLGYGRGLTFFPARSREVPRFFLGHVGILRGYCGATLHDPLTALTVTILMNHWTTVETCSSPYTLHAHPDGLIRSVFRQVELTACSVGSARKPFIDEPVPLELWRSFIPSGFNPETAPA